jgi:xylulokinase
VKVLAGFDIGTSSVKVLLVSAKGDVVASAASPVTSRSPQPGFLEESPDDWWEALSSALASLRANTSKDVSIAAIGLSGHMSGLVLLGVDHRPLRPCMLLADVRGSEEAAGLSSAIRARIVAQTGNVPSEVFTLAKLLWVREHEPALFARAVFAISAKDYIQCRLTGVVSTEPSDAGNFLLLKGIPAQWDAGLIDAIGVPPRLFPALKPSSEKVGELSASAAKVLGLNAGIPVVAGAADMACAAVGSGILTEGEAAVSLGTASPLIMPVEGIDASLVGKLTFHPHAIEGRRYALASILSGGRSYRWLAGVLNADQGAGIDLGALDRIAARAPAGSDGVLFLPFLTGSASPDWRSDARAAWIGMRAASGLAELGRAVLEGVAYNCRECIELCSRSGKKVQRLVVSGGGARSALWLGIIADVTGLPVQALGTAEASALGAAMLAGVGCGVFKNVTEAVSTMVRLGETIPPDAARTRTYEGSYDGYLLAKQKLLALDDELASVRRGALSV